MDNKRVFKNLVRKVKYYMSLDQDKDFRNDGVAKKMGLDPIYFNSLVSAKGEATEKHINMLIKSFPDYLSEDDIADTGLKEKSGPKTEPDLLTQIEDHANGILISLKELKKVPQGVFQRGTNVTPGTARKANISGKKKTD